MYHITGITNKKAQIDTKTCENTGLQESKNARVSILGVETMAKKHIEIRNSEINQQINQSGNK
jgi:hypothetical protein